MTGSSRDNRADLVLSFNTTSADAKISMSAGNLAEDVGTKPTVVMTEERKLLREARYHMDTLANSCHDKQLKAVYIDLGSRITALLATEPEPVEPCCQEWHTCMKRCVPLAENWRMDAKRLERQLAEAQRDADVREDKAYLRGLCAGHNSGTDQAKAIASQTSYASAIDQAIQEQKK